MKHKTNKKKQTNKQTNTNTKVGVHLLRMQPQGPHVRNVPPLQIAPACLWMWVDSIL